jgi:catechol 2,3-dioxygenase-like lactoylglutathione lyase family enzyme
MKTPGTKALLGRLVAFVSTTDADRARTFYGSVLGLRLVSDDGFAIVFDANGTPLRITKLESLAPAPFTVLGWEVANIAKTAARLRERGVAFERYAGMAQDDHGIWSVASAWLVSPRSEGPSLDGDGGAVAHERCATVTRRAHQHHRGAYWSVLPERSPLTFSKQISGHTRVPQTDAAYNSGLVLKLSVGGPRAFGVPNAPTLSRRLYDDSLIPSVTHKILWVTGPSLSRLSLQGPLVLVHGTPIGRGLSLPQPEGAEERALVFVPQQESHLIDVERGIRQQVKRACSPHGGQK